MWEVETEKRYQNMFPCDFDRKHAGGFYLGTSLLDTATVHISVSGDYVHSLVAILSKNPACIPRTLLVQ